MTLIRRLTAYGATLLIAATTINAQVVERPVLFDSAGLVTVMTPYIAQRADLRSPWWPVAGDFTEARLYTVNDSSYVLAVGRRSGVVERYNLSSADRDAIRAIVSRLPREVIAARHDARNAFVRNQTLLGLLVYAPTFAGSFADNTAGATAGYFVVAGGTFFAASEISRRILVSRAQNDLSTNLGRNGALAGWATMYLLHASNRAQSAGAFVGGIGGASLALRFARNMTESDAIGAGFGSNISSLIAWGTMEALKGESHCDLKPGGNVECGGRISDRAEVATILASGLIGYPLGLLYPRNARYNVTPGDIQTLYATTGLGILAAVAFLPESPKQSVAFGVATGGGVLGLVLGDHFLVQRFDHSRSEASRVTLGTYAGGLMGAGVAALIDTDLGSPQLVFGLASTGALLWLIASEHYVGAEPDAGRRGPRLSFNPGGIFLTAAHAPGNHSLINVRF
ncbi:MAG: hypothetical protein ABR537_14550 [Gemmatimonadales bacterium]